MRADRSLYLDGTRSRLVSETDPAVAWSLVGKGQEIDPGDVKRLGLVMHEGRVMQASQVPAPEPEPEATPEPEMVEGYEPTAIMPPQSRRSRRKY